MLCLVCLPLLKPKQKIEINMSKKHYNSIAGIIKSTIDKSKREGWESSQASRALVVASESIALDVADFFASENPAFNRSRFLTACGVL